MTLNFIRVTDENYLSILQGLTTTVEPGFFAVIKGRITQRFTHELPSLYSELGKIVENSFDLPKKAILCEKTQHLEGQETDLGINCLILRDGAILLERYRAPAETGFRLPLLKEPKPAQ